MGCVFVGVVMCCLVEDPGGEEIELIRRHTPIGGPGLDSELQANLEDIHECEECRAKPTPSIAEQNMTMFDTKLVNLIQNQLNLMQCTV